jgi:RNA polymerase sigma factor (sigma-70 family)
MAPAVPPELSRLINAADESARQEAWEVFVQNHSKLLIHAVRSMGGGYDATMDRYAHVLERLRSDDFQRLRAYAPMDCAKFTTWLVVVARRLGVDYQRHQYGRNRSSESPDSEALEQTQRVRRKLADLVAVDMDLEAVSDDTRADPASNVIQVELREALERVMSILPTRDRLLLALRFEHEVSVREIADVMGFPSQFHVYRRLKKVTSELRDALEREGIHEATG